MQVFLFAYAAILLVVAYLSSRREEGFQRFVLAGRNQPSILIIGSMLASTIGGGLTIGTVSKAYSLGFPAFWFVASGAVAHLVQAAFLSEKVRRTEALTLPDLAEKLSSPSVRKLTGVIIVLTWTGIAAGQPLDVGHRHTIEVPGNGLFQRARRHGEAERGLSGPALAKTEDQSGGEAVAAANTVHDPHGVSGPLGSRSLHFHTGASQHGDDRRQRLAGHAVLVLPGRLVVLPGRRRARKGATGRPARPRSAARRPALRWARHGNAGAVSSRCYRARVPRKTGGS